MNPQDKAIAKRVLMYIVGAIIAIIAIVTTASCFYRVDEGELAIETRYGEIVSESTSGLHFKSPINSVALFSTREVRMDVGKFESNGDVTSGISAYTKDQQSVMAAVTLTYKIVDPSAVYKRYRTSDNLVAQVLTPNIRSQYEILFSQYSASDAIIRRQELTNRYVQLLREALKDKPIEITSLQLVIQFSKAYEQNAERSAQLDIELKTKERATLIAKQDAEKKRVEAQAIADAKLIEAKANAESVELMGMAEAKAMREKAEAMKGNSELAVYRAAERWDGRLPTQMVPGSTLPFINVTPQGAK